MDNRLKLCKTIEGDEEVICKWMNAKENIKHMSSFVRETKHTIESVRNSILNKDDDEILFTIKVDDLAIGHAGFEDIDNTDNTAEIYFLIGDENFKGKGLGKFIVLELLKFGFDTLNLNNIIATVSVENIPSIKSLKKCGFKKIGVRREYNNVNGRRIDEAFFDITRNDWKEMK